MLEQNQVKLELSGKHDGERRAITDSAEAVENKFILTRCQKLRVLCGYESILLLLIFLGVGGGHFFIFTLYPSNWRWVYFAMALLSCLLSISFVLRTISAVFTTEKKMKKEPSSQESTDAKETIDENAVVKDGPVLDNPTEATQSTNTSEICKYFYKVRTIVAILKEVFEVNGKYYLVKLYVSEAIENIWQLYTIFTLYLCILPLRMATILSFFLVAELVANLYVTFHLTSQIVRDRLLMIDMITDLFCLAFPLLYNYFAYQMPLSIFESFQILLIPTFCLISKANDVWVDVLNVDLQRIEAKRVASRRRSSRRSSIFALESNREIFGNQLEQFPKKCRYGFAVVNVFFLLCFFAIGINQVVYHISYTNNGRQECQLLHTKQIWDQCILKIPFCNNPFVGRCDCAILTLKNYTETKFPPSFEGLHSLKVLNVYTGRLEKLPDNIGEKQANIVKINIIRNPLKRLPNSASKLKQLISLRLLSTNITKIPNPVQWTSLVTLRIRQSKLRTLPENIGLVQMLSFLDLEYNLIQKLPDSIGSLEHLQVLLVSGNSISELPDSITTLKNLQYIYGLNNKLSKLPKNIGNMKALATLDVRDNLLKGLPASILNLESVWEFYVARNPLCPHYKFPSNLVKAEGLCEEQCSARCLNKWKGDGFCDDNELSYELSGGYIPPKSNSGCNTANCNHDGEDCSQP
jgi:hypothetical protein